MKKIICVFMLICLLFSLTSCAPQRTMTKNLNKYDKYLSKVEYSQAYMPSIELLGEYSEATITYKYKYLVFFETYTVGVFLSYDDTNYSKQKEAILSDYEFFTTQDEKVGSDWEAFLDNYHIRLVKEDYKYSTRQMGLLIGMDDTNCKICYLFYYDFDLDELKDLDSYIQKYFYIP